MPGLVGFTNKQNSLNSTVLSSMRQLLRHADNYVDEELFINKDTYASRTHLGILKQGRQPYAINGQLFSWLEGEFFNQGELKSKYHVTATTDNELLANIYSSTKSFDFLRDIDGCYSAVLYDVKDRKILLIVDRYGFKPLYWGAINDNLIWSSELKGFLAHPDFEPVIDRCAVDEFFNKGYLLENRSWFEGVEMLPPASILSFDVEQGKVDIKNYWSWDEIREMTGEINEDDLANELGRLFTRAVCKRTNNEEKIGIALSGGLDSRAILAAIPNSYKPLHAFTFGLRRCDDIRIASAVARIKGAKHHVFELDSHNWFEGKTNAVWRSDAGYNLIHMHGTTFYSRYRPYIDFIFNGLRVAFAVGTHDPEPFNPQTEAHLIRNEHRRFINQALVLGETRYIYRRPYADKELADFAFSIPGRLRRGSYIYLKMLLTTFPEYYRHIRWNSSILVPPPTEYIRFLEFKAKAWRKLKLECRRLGVDFTDLRHYSDYPKWIRKEPARSYFEEFLSNKDALYPEYIDWDKIQDYLTDHMQGRANRDWHLCAALTFELWLQQVFNGNYRDIEEQVHEVSTI